MNTLNRAIPVLLETFGDSIRCVRYATNGFSRIEVTALVLAYLLASVGAFLSVIYLISNLPWWTGVASHQSVSAGLLLVAVLLVMRTSIQRAFGLWDFVGDVVSYIGNGERRESTVATMRSIIEAGTTLSPRARLIIVGHSLGSVLVTHSLLASFASNGSCARTIVVTLGSPLKSLAGLFPEIIRSPEALSDFYGKHGAVTGWVNLWRDADVIGRDFRPEPRSPLFTETSLGDGPHTNYWSDQRFWDCIAKIIQLDHGKQPLPLAEAIGDGSVLTEDEQLRVLAQRPGAFVGAMGLGLLTGALLWLTVWLPVGSAAWLAKCAWTACAVTAAVGIAIALRVALVEGSPRRRIATARFWRPIQMLVGRLWFLAACSLLVMAWWNK